MAAISDIISVSITAETAAISQAGFGTMNVLGEAMRLPRVDSVVLTFSANLVTSNKINMLVNGVALTEVTFTTDNDTTLGLIATALAALDEVDTAVVSGVAPNKHVITVTGVYEELVNISNVVVTLGASQATCTIARTAATRIRYYASLTAVAEDFETTDLEYQAAASAFSQNPRPTLVAISRKDTTAGDTWVEALDAVRLESDEWYGLVITSRTQADVEDVAEWAEAQTKLFATTSPNADILMTGDTDIAAVLQAAAYDRSFIIYHPDADETADDSFPEAAAFGKLLPTTPGSITMMFKTLAGVAVTSLTTTEATNALAKNCNVYETIGGVNVLREGKVASGEYIDIMHGIDWLQARIAEAVFSRLANLPKIPFTDAGVAIITTEIRKIIQQGIDNGFLAVNTDPDVYGGKTYLVTAPLVVDVSANDRANRLLPDIEFAAKLAGAVHYVQIAGTVSV